MLVSRRIFGLQHVYPVLSITYLSSRLNNVIPMQEKTKASFLQMHSIKWLQHVSSVVLHPTCERERG